MQFLGKIVEILSLTAATPKLFGWVHILSFALAVGLGVFLSIRFKNADQKTVRTILFITSVLTIAFEIYKQFVFSASFDGQTVTFDYQWYAFPFQFCSTPMYVGLLASLIKKEWLHKTLCAFLATYGLFAGLVVMFYPGDVFMSIIGINIQTMVCHGLMVSIGIFLLASGYVRPKHSSMLPAICTFAFLISIAMILNEVFYFSGIIGDETFNMFFISRHFPPHLPVYSAIQNVIPFPFCIFFYILGFSSAAYVLLLINIAVQSIVKKVRAKRGALVQ
jgi:hypothetical protein